MIINESLTNKLVHEIEIKISDLGELLKTRECRVDKKQDKLYRFLIKSCLKDAIKCNIG